MFANISADFFDADVRVEVILCLGMGAANPEALPDTFSEDFFEDFLAGADHDSTHLAPLTDHIPGLAAFMGSAAFEDIEAMQMADWFISHNVYGFLAKVATPVRKYFPDGLSYLSGWGHTRFTWIYADTIELLAERALAWAGKEVAEWKAAATGGAS